MLLLIRARLIEEHKAEGFKGVKGGVGGTPPIRKETLKKSGVRKATGLGPKRTRRETRRIRRRKVGSPEVDCYEWVSCFALSFCSSPSNRSVSTLLPLFLSSLTSHSYQLVANRFFPLLLCAPRSGWCFWFLRALDFGFCLGLLFARLTNHNSSSLVIIHHHHHHPLHLHYFIHHLFILLKKIFFF